MSGINFQRSYHLGQEYENIKDRATKIVGKHFEDSNLISFDDVEKRVTFTSERLVPVNRSKRPPVMLLFSNPHPHSIKQGMFLSANIKNRENLFWPTMRNAGGFQSQKQNVIRKIFETCSFGSNTPDHSSCISIATMFFQHFTLTTSPEFSEKAFLVK